MGNTIGPGSTYDVETLIIGGGPTGLGAAYRLTQLKQDDWVLVDADKQPGGLAGSFKTPEGFRFDHGYMVIPTRYDYIQKLLAELGPQEGEKKQKDFIDFIEKVRNNFVYIRGNLVKYPIQNNLSGLPPKEQADSVADLMKAQLMLKHIPEDAPKPNNLDDWLLENWGETLTNLFFRPMMFKTWAHPTTKLSADWVDYKIAPADLKRDIVRTVDGAQNDDQWGAGATFHYPKKGGLGGIWKAIAKKLPRNNVKFRAEVVQIDLESKTAKTRDDIEIKYKNLISTMPLSTLLDLCGKQEQADRLLHSSLHLVCLGVRGKPNLADVSGCIFYPEVGTIFHKACVFSSVDSDSVPEKGTELITLRRADNDIAEDDDDSYKPGPYWSIMLEISEGPLKEISNATLVEQVIIDCLGVGLLKPADEIVSMHVTQMTHGFPVPTTDRDEVVNESLEWLKEKNVWSRGRFGAFKYEVGGADHCFIQGVEAVDNIVHGQAETTAFDSTAANVLGVIQPKPYFAVDQLLAEINGEPEAEAAEAEEPVESETEPAAEPEEAAEAVAEPVVDDEEAETESTVVVDAAELPPAAEAEAAVEVAPVEEAAAAPVEEASSEDAAAAAAES